MGIWVDKIKTHDIWTSLQILGNTIDKVSSVNFTISEDNAEGIERLRQILAFTGKRLAATDPFLLDLTLLDSVNANLREISSTLELFMSTEEESRLITVQSIADAILNHLSKVLQPIPLDDLTIINESLTNYRNNITEYTQAESEKFEFVNEKINSINTTLVAHEQKLTEEQSRLAALTNEQQSQFSSMQDTRASEFANGMNEFKQAFVTSKLENQEQVNALINDFDKKLNQLHSRMASQHEKAAKNYKDDLINLRDEYGTNAKNLLDEIREHRIEVEKLVGVIGNLGVTSGYLTEANVARKRLYVWQVLTVAALAGLVWIAYLMAFPTPTENLVALSKSTLNAQFVFYQTLAARVFLSITFGIFAAYSARQAEKYMEMDRRNRKLALELAAVGPYISTLPTEMQNKFKIDLGEKSFGVTESASPTSTDPVTFWDVVKSKEFEELFEKFMKRVRSAEN